MPFIQALITLLSKLDMKDSEHWNNCTRPGTEGGLRECGGGADVEGTQHCDRRVVASLQMEWELWSWQK